jgi:hypothetical protein
LDDAFRDAAQDDVLDARPSVSADDAQIRAGLLGVAHATLLNDICFMIEASCEGRASARHASRRRPASKAQPDRARCGEVLVCRRKDCALRPSSRRRTRRRRLAGRLQSSTLMYTSPRTLLTSPAT